MVEFAKSDNFMKLIYLGVACTIVAVGFINKQEVVDLYKFTIGVCS